MSGLASSHFVGAVLSFLFPFFFSSKSFTQEREITASHQTKRWLKDLSISGKFTVASVQMFPVNFLSCFLHTDLITAFFLKHLEKPRGDNCIKKPYFFLSFVLTYKWRTLCVNPSNLLLFYLLYLLYLGTDMPYWLQKTTMRPNEIIFI